MEEGGIGAAKAVLERIETTLIGLAKSARTRPGIPPSMVLDQRQTNP